MKNLRSTSSENYVSYIRIMLGGIFLMTGIMKLTMPEYGEAWSIQLIEAEIPFYTFNYWFVPLLEVTLGIILLIGFYSRLAGAMVVPIMLVATYVHLTVTHPGAFPAQPQEPIMPVAILMMVAIIIWKGAGNWSLDLIANNAKKLVRS